MLRANIVTESHHENRLLILQVKRVAYQPLLTPLRGLGQGSSGTLPLYEERSTNQNLPPTTAWFLQ